MIGLTKFVDRGEKLIETLQNIKIKPISSHQVLKSTKYNDVATFRQKPIQIFDDLYKSFETLLERASIINSDVYQKMNDEITSSNIDKEKDDEEEHEQYVQENENVDKESMYNDKEEGKSIYSEGKKAIFKENQIRNATVNPDFIDVSSLLSTGVDTALGTLADIKMKSLNNFNLLLNKFRKSRKSKESEYRSIKSNYITSRESDRIESQITEKEIELNQIDYKIEVEKKFFKLLKDHGSLEASVVEKMLYDNIIEMKQKLLDKIDDLKRKISDIEFDHNNHSTRLDQLKSRVSNVYQSENDDADDKKKIPTSSINSTRNIITENEINYNEKAIQLLNELFSMAMKSLKVASTVSDKRKQFETLINSDQAKAAANLKEKVAMKNIQVKNLERNMTELIELRDRHQGREVKNKADKKATLIGINTTITADKAAESTPETITNTTNTIDTNNNVNNIEESTVTPEMWVIARAIERVSLENLVLNQDGFPDDSDLVINQCAFSSANKKQLDDDDLNVKKNFGASNHSEKSIKLHKYQRMNPAQESLLRIVGGIEGLHDVEDYVDESRNYDNDFGISMAVNQMRKLLYVFNSSINKESDIEVVTHDLRVAKKKIRKYELDINRRLQLLKKNESMLVVVKNERDDARRSMVPHVEELKKEMPVLHNGEVVPNERFVRDPKDIFKRQDSLKNKSQKKNSSIIKETRNSNKNNSDLGLNHSSTGAKNELNVSKTEPQLEYVMEEDDVMLLEKEHTYEELMNKLLDAENEEKKLLEDQSALRKKLEKLNEYEFKEAPAFAKPSSKKVVVKHKPEIVTPPPKGRMRVFTMNLKKRNSTLIKKPKPNESSNDNGNTGNYNVSTQNVSNKSISNDDMKQGMHRLALSNGSSNPLEVKTDTMRDSNRTRKYGSATAKKFPNVYFSRRTSVSVPSFSYDKNKPRQSTINLSFNDNDMNALHNLKNKLGRQNVLRKRQQSFMSTLAAIQQKKLQRVLAKKVQLAINLPPLNDSKPRRFEELKLSSSFWFVKLHEEITKMKQDNIRHNSNQQKIESVIHSATVPIIQDDFLSAIEILENDIKTTLQYIRLVGGGSLGTWV